MESVLTSLVYFEIPKYKHRVSKANKLFLQLWSLEQKPSIGWFFYIYISLLYIFIKLISAFVLMN